MDLKLTVLDPGPDHRGYWTPFETNAGFYYEHWNRPQKIHRDCINLRGLIGGDEVIRIELDAGPLRAQYRGLERLAAPPLRIQMIETNIRYRRRGIGERALDLLHDAYPDLVLIAFSDADEFWDGVGWDRYVHIDDEPDAPRMYFPLYVDPRPVR